MTLHQCRGHPGLNWLRGLQKRTGNDYARSGVAYFKELFHVRLGKAIDVLCLVFRNGGYSLKPYSSLVTVSISVL